MQLHRTNSRTEAARSRVGPAARGVLRRSAVLTAAVALTGTALTGAWAPPAAADSATGQCTFPGKKYQGRPWSLQRIMLNQLWAQSQGAERKTGKPVKVAVIDTGVDVHNPQLKTAVESSSGTNVLPPDTGKDKSGKRAPRGNSNGTSDSVGHGTKVAGIIAARPGSGTGFTGLAPKAKIMPIVQNDANGSGTAGQLAKGITYAANHGAQVINISQDTAQQLKHENALTSAVRYATQQKDVVVVASSGNDGLGGKVKKTYPAAYDGVLAVAASDRNNERAPFSQSGDFVGIAAPGVDMVSTVPKGGHCPDRGTSFSAPFVAGVAALVRAKHPDWEQDQVVAQLEQTAERSISGRDNRVGWGVVDPLRALTDDDKPQRTPHPSAGLEHAEAPKPATLSLGETTQERNERLGTYAVIGGGLLTAVIAGAAFIYRDWRRRTHPTK